MKIVLVSLDCIRSDYFPQKGFIPLIQKGFLFDTCITAASHTSTSHTTMLTGTYPFDHGVRWLVKYNVKDKMVQEVLREKGYRTAAFIGGFPLTQGDLDRGFDVFDHSPLVEDMDEGRSHYVPANILVQKAANFLNNDEKDAFVFIHMFDAHLTLRSEFDVDHAPPEKDKTGRYKDIEKHLGRRERRYCEEIDMMGSQLRRLTELANIDLLMITADHGEKMQGEKDYPWVYNHKNEPVGSHFHEVELWDKQLKVPLLIWGKDIDQGASSSMVRTIDIAPTILEVAGQKDKDLAFRGISLISALKNGEMPDIEHAYSETYFAQMRAENLHASEMTKKFKWGWKAIDSLVSIRSKERKLICTADGKIEPIHFYDLVNDPDEEIDIIEDPDHLTEIHYLFSILLEMVKDDIQFKYDTIKEEVKGIQSAIRSKRLKGI